MASQGLPLYLATFLTGLLECIGFAGVLFGWTSLLFVFKEEHYFLKPCEQDCFLGSNGTGPSDINAQAEKFSLIFTLASFMNNFMTFPTGYIFDRFKTTVARLIAILFYTCATLIIAFTSADTAMLLFLAMPMLAVGGILFLITNLQIGNLFGKHRSTIITLYNGAFDSSSAVFLIIKDTHAFMSTSARKSESLRLSRPFAGGARAIFQVPFPSQLLYEQGISLRHSFVFLSVCSIWHVGRTFLLMPQGHIPYPLPPNYSYGLCSRFGTRKEENKAAEHETKELQSKECLSPKEENSGLEQQQQQQQQQEQHSFRRCVLSRRFILHVVWLSVIQLWHYLFIGTLNSLLTKLADEDNVKVSAYTNAFAITQFFGVLCAPWNGLLMDCLKQKYQKEAKRTGSSSKAVALCSMVPSLALTSLLSLGFTLCASIPVIELQYATFILQVVSRSFLYGSNAAFLTLAFPSEHFGKLFGLVMALSAIVSLLQFPLFKVSPESNAVYVSMGLAIFLTLVHPFLVYRECRAEKTKLSVDA